MSSKQGLTVKEYAAAQGISTTVVYRMIKANKLETFETVSNGKKVKCIAVSEGEGRNGLKPMFETVSNTFETDKTAELAAAIAERDKRIVELQKRVDELTDSVIEQNKQLTELVRESHILLHNSQMLLNQAEPPQIQESIQQPKKRPFWKRKKTDF